MLGKASGIKTWYVEPIDQEEISDVINRVLDQLGDREVISITFHKSQNVDISDSGLIIYKEITE